MSSESNPCLLPCAKGGQEHLWYLRIGARDSCHEKTVALDTIHHHVHFIWLALECELVIGLRETIMTYSLQAKSIV